MLRSRSLTILPRHFKIKSPEKYLVRFINCIRPESHSNISCFNRLSFLKSHNVIRLQHNKLQLELTKDQEKFFQVLTKLENENKLSLNSIKTIIHELHTLLDDVALEKEHENKLLQSELFLKLLKAVEESIHEVEVNDIVRYLDLCNSLHIVHKIDSVLNILRKVKDNAKNLTLANQVKVCLLLHNDLMAINKELILDLRKYFMMTIEKAIKNKSYRNSPDDTVAALEILSLLKRLSVDDKIHVLYSILDLKNWNNGMIFKLFLKANIPFEHPLTEDIKERFLKRMKKEIETSNKFLSDFLVGYSSNINKSFIEYDKDLVDASISQILKNKINTQQIRKICFSLSLLDHCNYEFVEYLIRSLEKNPNIYSSHPAISARIIETVANASCNYDERNRWARIAPIVKNATNLAHVFDLCRKDSEISYLYFLTQLASLGIFIDEELNRLRKTLTLDQDKKDNTYLSSWNIRMLVTNLNSAVKVLYPDYPEPILNKHNLNFVMNKLFSVHKESRSSLIKLDLLMDVQKSLESSSGVTNCILLNSMNKFGFAFDGLIGVNKDGKLFDFKTSFQKDKKVFMEDVSLPAGYDLVALHVATRAEQSRNTWDLKAANALRLKIAEGLGFRTVIIYESLWKSLRNSEKEKYLYALQG